MKLPTIDIKGKAYVQVAERVKYFNETYTNGHIQTLLVTPPESKLVVFRAIITPDDSKPTRFFTGYSQAVVGDGMVNKTSALENAETSAIGRALGFMGIGIVDSIASVDEMVKAGAYQPAWKKPVAKVNNGLPATQRDDEPFTSDEIQL